MTKRPVRRKAPSSKKRPQPRKKSGVLRKLFVWFRASQTPKARKPKKQRRGTARRDEDDAFSPLRVGSPAWFAIYGGGGGGYGGGSSVGGDGGGASALAQGVLSGAGFSGY